MRLIFTKGGGKHDDLRIERDEAPPETVACPKQGIIPHEMIHFAVESTLARGGFLALVAQGRDAGFATLGGAQEEAVERLVECFQAEMWGGRVPAADLIAAYEHACGARGHPAAPVSQPEIEAIRALVDQLTQRWAALPVGDSIAVEVPPSLS